MPIPHENGDTAEIGMIVDCSIPPEFDNSQAGEEGWGIFNCDGSYTGEFKLCRLDEEEIFADDEQAWCFVVEKVAAGSAYHRAALDYIREHNPIEWASFGEVHREPLVHCNGASMLNESGELIDQHGAPILNEFDQPYRFKPEGGTIWDTPPKTTDKS